jgi:hypothetical protein
MTKATSAPTGNRSVSCEANGGRCNDLATVDLGAYTNQMPGTPGYVRFLCCRHSRGSMAHRACQADHENQANR